MHLFFFSLFFTVSLLQCLTNSICPCFKKYHKKVWENTNLLGRKLKCPVCTQTETFDMFSIFFCQVHWKSNLASGRISCYRLYCHHCPTSRWAAHEGAVNAAPSVRKEAPPPSQTPSPPPAQCLPPALHHRPHHTNTAKERTNPSPIPRPAL